MFEKRDNNDNYFKTGYKNYIKIWWDTQAEKPSNFYWWENKVHIYWTTFQRATATLRDLSLIFKYNMFAKLPIDWFYQSWTNSPIEDNVKAIGLQVNVSSPIANVKIFISAEIHATR